MKQKHNLHSFHLRRLMFFCILLAAFFVVRVDAGQIPGGNARSASVLAYATEMSRGALHAGTNAARSANGFGNLALNSQLNSAAQAKAEHMAANDYWAHVAPDGTQPWFFFDQAGYDYIRAGENLAYGFLTSQATIDGWMDSPTHRANILGDYQDVGFGIVNSPSFQGKGNQTIVVAHYGTRPSAPEPPPAAAPAAPLATNTPPTAPSSAPATPQSTSSPSSPSAPATSPVSSDKPDSGSKESDDAKISPNPAVAVAKPSRVSVLSMMSDKRLPLAALVSLTLICVAAAGYAMTHRVAFQHALATGEHFVIHHPGLDTAVFAALTTLILLTTYGNIG